MTKIHYTPEAEQDLHEIKSYIETELKSKSAANKVLTEITKRIRMLENFPRSGRRLSAIIDIETDYRFIGCGSYLAFYRVEDDDVYIIRIIHSRRDYIAILIGELPLDVH